MTSKADPLSQTLSDGLNGFAKDPTSKSKAIYLPSSGEAEFRIVSDETYKPSYGQSLVRVLYSGVNPSDLKHRSLGIHSTIIGYDYCGLVLQTSPGSPFKVGEVIAGCNPSGISRLPAYGTHQNRLLAVNDMAFKVPTNLPMADAAGLAIPLRAAIVALYNHLHLPLPWTPGTPGPLLIWGGSSTVGACAIQLAKASGCSPIYVTASSSKHDELRDLGATRCFDYTAPDVVNQIRDAVKADSVRLTMAFDAVGLPGTDSLEAEYYSQNSMNHMAERCFDVLEPNSTSTSPPRVITTVPGASGRAGVINAMPDWDVDWKLPDHGLTILETKPAEAEALLEVVDWVVANYGTKFKLPHVRIVEWGTAVTELKKSAEGKSGGGKVVIQH